MGVVEKEMMHRLFYIATLFVAVLGIVSCQPHDALCFEHPHGAKVRIGVDWSAFKEEDPSGMSVSVFSATDSTRLIQQTTEMTDGVEFNLLPKDYIAIVHNQGVAEFGHLAFSGMDKLSTAKIAPERCSSDWYTPIEDEALVLNPEWLAFDKKDFLATQDVIEEKRSNDEANHEQQEYPLVATLTPRSVVYTLHLSIDVRGINNYRAARAAITGMADGYSPGTGEYSAQRVTHLIEEWEVEKRYVHTDGVQEGSITAQIGCFGLPTGHDGAPSSNKLRLSMLLADNKTVVNHVFNVGHKIYRQATADNSLHLYLDLQFPDKLPDVIPEQGDTGQSGFDAEVNDWSDEENTEVIM